VDSRAGKYNVQVDLWYDQLTVTVHEQRAQPGGDVVRVVTAERRGEHEWTYRPGPAFVPPPTEEILEGWVARNEPPAAFVEESSLLGPGTYTVLLRHLPPDGERLRVLVQQDFWPTGVIEAFDDARAEIIYETGPSWEMRRREPEMIGSRESERPAQGPLTPPVPQGGDRGSRRRTR
jgi:hypothetical protein